MEQEISDIKVTLDNLLVQTTMLSNQMNVLTNMTLGVYKETLPLGQYQNIYTNYVNLYEEFMNDSFSKIEDVLFQENDNLFLIRQKTELLSQLQRMKLDTDYISIKKSTP